MKKKTKTVLRMNPGGITTKMTTADLTPAALRADEENHRTVIHREAEALVAVATVAKATTAAATNVRVQAAANKMRFI